MDSNEIKELIEGLLKHMQVAVDSIETKDSAGRECFSVKTPDSHMLIGAKGANLFALNHIVKKIVSSKGAAKKALSGNTAETATQNEIGKERSFFIDVNGYQEAATENIKNLAKIMGDRARSFKANVELETESVGEGEKRRVVIKYVEDKAS